jgi:hypothetical protein
MMKPLIVPLILLALVCAGCPLTLTPEMMKSQVTVLDHRGTADILVTVFGATDISKRKAVQFTDETYAQALRSSLEQSRLFRKALSDSQGHYQLQATVVQLNEYIFGLDMTASMAVSYILARTSPKEPLWEKTINSSHTAGMSDSVISITRLQRATEGAARKNIERALQEIAALRLE